MEREPITWKSLSKYEKFKDVLTILSGLSVLTLIFINMYNIKNIIAPPKIYNNDVVIKYMDAYGAIAPDVSAYNHACKEGICYPRTDTLMKNYFAISEQELFYIKNKVISPEIADEWLTSMLRQMQKFSHEIGYKDALVSYGRVRTTFNYNLDTLQQPVDSSVVPSPISEEQLNICRSKLESYNTNVKHKPGILGTAGKP